MATAPYALGYHTSDVIQCAAVPDACEPQANLSAFVLVARSIKVQTLHSSVGSCLCFATSTCPHTLQRFRTSQTPHCRSRVSRPNRTPVVRDSADGHASHLQVSGTKLHTVQHWKHGAGAGVSPEVSSAKANCPQKRSTRLSDWRRTEAKDPSCESRDAGIEIPPNSCLSRTRICMRHRVDVGADR